MVAGLNICWKVQMNKKTEERDISKKGSEDKEQSGDAHRRVKLSPSSKANCRCKGEVS